MKKNPMKEQKKILLEIEENLWSIFEDLRHNSLQTKHCVVGELMTPMPHNGPYEGDTNKISTKNTYELKIKK